ncbi:MAG: hypothetical protein K1X39_11895 [Thermoflexales bacterium]|nr:hypothetical protein [Thermoflexales bacterium]
MTASADPRLLSVALPAHLEARAGSVALRAAANAPAQRIVFGLPLLVGLEPLLIWRVNTERGTKLVSLALFGWIEDRFIDEPRAELFGCTPSGVEPIAFLRDLDLDRPPEAFVLTESGTMTRVTGLRIDGPSGAPGDAPAGADAAALRAIEADGGGTAAPLAALRAAVAGGQPLRHALRALRRDADPGWMARCDGWRLLTRACWPDVEILR